MEEQFEKAKAAAEPDPATVRDYVFVPTPVTEELGERSSRWLRKK